MWARPQRETRDLGECRETSIPPAFERDWNLKFYLRDQLSCISTKPVWNFISQNPSKEGLGLISRFCIRTSTGHTCAGGVSRTHSTMSTMVWEWIQWTGIAHGTELLFHWEKPTPKPHRRRRNPFNLPVGPTGIIKNQVFPSYHLLPFGKTIMWHNWDSSRTTGTRGNFL